MRKIIFMVSLMTCSIHLKAQPFESGTNMINAGIGLGSSLGSFGYTSQTPGISASFERGMWEVGGHGVISLGGYLGYKAYKFTSTYLYNGGIYSYSNKWSYLILGARSAYHYNGLSEDKIDLYGGVMLSFYSRSHKYEDNNPAYDYPYVESGNSGLNLSLYAGGRYMFSDNIGAFLELSHGISFLSLGVTFKF
jgi:hypothetical protein